MNDRFPFGYEKILTKKILGVDLADEEYPSDKNILVMNLQTILVLGEIVQIYYCFRFDECESICNPSENRRTGL